MKLHLCGFNHVIKDLNARGDGQKMAEEGEPRQRSVQPTGPEPVLSQDRDEEGGRNESTIFSKLFATMLILPGIVLYVYILYIVLANLLYPSSFAPFLPHRASQKEENTTSTKLGKYLYGSARVCP